ncbi:MAG: hypothetical protein ACE5FU_14705, partial [Nitrospinota bacterium]
MSVLPKPVADTSSCYKSAFIVLSLTALIVMPVLSLDFGITWDEPDHNTYGKLLLNYFLSFGNDKSSLSFRNL